MENRSNKCYYDRMCMVVGGRGPEKRKLKATNKQHGLVLDRYVIAAGQILNKKQEKNGSRVGRIEKKRMCK